MSAELDPANDDRLAASVRHSRLAWRRLWLQLQSTTPSAAGRGLLVALGIAVIVWLVVVSWPALLPFAIGGAVAYVVLPVVNRLNTVMPRPLAVILTMAGVALLIALIFRLIIPPLAEEISRAVLTVPRLLAVVVDREQVDAFLVGLPEPVRAALQRALDNTVLSLEASINRRLDDPLRSLNGVLGWLADSLGFVLGFLVIPTWLLLVLRDQRAAARALGRIVPAWLAPDFWAVMRIVDRIFGAFVRGQLVLGIAVGGAAWAGLTLLDAFYGQAGLNAQEYTIAVAALVGLCSLVPIIGQILGLLAAALIGWTFSGEVAILATLVVLAAQLVVRQTVAPHVDRRVSDLHPAILLMAIAALSQFGIIWVFLAAPIAVTAQDLYRYAFRRIGDPPLPASAALARVGVASVRPRRPRRRTPLAYRQYQERQAR